MSQIDRRNFIKLLSAAGAVSAVSGLLVPSTVAAKAKARVVVVGGGFGGATCASYLRTYDSSLEVTLIEPSAQFVTCPFSNTVLAGMKTMDFITHDYDGLRKNRGVNVVHDTVTAIDAAAKKVTLKGGKTLSYDRLVVSPGVSFNWNEIEGASEENSLIMPHAWKAGAQTTLLRKQLEAMKDGGTVVIASPRKPFRAPPAPYERASLIAHYLKQSKPACKILVVDSSGKSEELGLFREGWDNLYKGMIDLARRSGQILSLFAHCVYEHDHLELAYGLDPRLEHRPCLAADAGALVGAYAVAHLVGGGQQFVFLPRHKIEAIRAGSRSGRDGPWATHFDEMAQKTAARALFKWLPVSVEAMTAVGLDAQAEAGEPQDNGALLGDGDGGVLVDENGVIVDGSVRSAADLNQAL